MTRTSRHEVIQELREQLRQAERGQRPAREPIFSTGTPLDRLLPGGGLEWGRLVEWLSEGEGTGVVTLGLSIAGRLMRRGGVFVVIDRRRQFYPPAAAALGVPPEQTVIVQPSNERDALWALEQSLRCTSVAVAMGWLEGVNDRAYRRLQLAAETGGSIGFLMRPVAFRAQPSWAAVRLLVTPSALHRLRGRGVGGEGGRQPTETPLIWARRLHIDLLHFRGGPSGETIDLDLNDETGDVRLAAELAHPAPARWVAGA